MARTDNLSNYLTDIATAIKAKTGSSAAIQASAFDTEIGNIDTGPDWTQIGYSEAPGSIEIGFNVAKNIYDNWDSSSRNYRQLYANNQSIIYFPSVQTNTTNMSRMFYGCGALQEVGPLTGCAVLSSMFYNCTALKKVGTITIPSNMSAEADGMFENCSGLKSVSISGKINFSMGMFRNCKLLEYVSVLDFSAMTNDNFSNMFEGCTSLSDTALDNILQTCISATQVTSGKTLSEIGINGYSSRIPNLPHYQDFINAGWTM